MTDRDILTVEVALDLKQPLETLAGSLQQSPAWIVNRALEEYLDRRLRPDHDLLVAGTTSSYVELTAREGQFDFL
jgi:predicted transcriptional regulator